jgi:signal transduction histidine kinase
MSVSPPSTIAPPQQISQAPGTARPSDRASQLTAALAIARQITSILDPDDLLDQAVAQIQQVFGCDYVALLLPDGDVLTQRSFAGLPDRLPDLRVESDSACFAARAYRAGRAISGGSERECAPPVDAPAWCAAFPLLSGSQALGVVEAWRRGAAPWSDAELEALDALAPQIGASLFNARRYAEAQRHARDLVLLDRVRASFAAQASLPELLRDVVDQTADVLGYPLVSLYMLQGDQLTLLHQRGYPSLPHSLAFGAGVLAGVVRDGVPARHRYTALLPREQAEELGITASLCVPLRAGRVVCGALVVECTSARGLAQGDQQLLMALAELLAMSMEFSHLYEALETRVTQQALVDDISRTVTASLDQDAALRAIVTQVPRAVPCQRLTLASYNPDGHIFTVRALWLADGETATGVGASEEIGDTEAGVALRTGRLHYVHDLNESLYPNSVQWRAEGLRSAVHVPILAPEGCLGMLSLSRSTPNAFSASDRALLGSLAPHIATAFRNAQLYAQAQQAYAELAAAQERNVQAEKLRALGELASGVAHDFNNLLTIILGHMELLRSTDSPNFEASRRTIIQAAQDGAHTVRRIREFVRVKPEQHTTPVDLAELADDVLQLTKPRWHAAMLKKGITIRATTELRPVPPVLGSAPELREVVTNLILNAVDAMPEGGTLVLSTGVEGQQAWLEVADTGQGIPPAVRERIFEPFYTTKAQRGTGLGLAVSRSIARRHEGDLTVESTPGVGSRFRLCLPVKEPPAAPAAAAAPVAPAGPLRILLVEDDRPVRETLAQLFGLDGHAVTACGSGAEALELFVPGAFDVVCSDLGMPGMNGWELIGELRAREPGLVTILLSGWGAQIDAEEARAKHVDFVVAKPIDMDALAAALAHAGRRGSPGGA